MKSLLCIFALTLTAFGQVSAKVTAATTTSNGSVQLACTGASTDTGFTFYRQSTTATVVGSCPTTGYTSLGTSSTCSYTDSTAQPSTNYCYVATASIGSAESVYSAPAIALVPALPPPPPTGLTVVSVVANNVNLKWKAPNQPVLAYRLYRKPTSAQTWGDIANAITGTSFTDQGLRPNSYNYEVVAVYNQQGNKVLSGPSNVVIAQVK